MKPQDLFARLEAGYEYDPMYGELCNERDRLADENTKMRELVHILCHCMQINAKCDDCRLNGAKGELALDHLCACDGLHKLLREIGIEVD